MRKLCKIALWQKANKEHLGGFLTFLFQALLLVANFRVGNNTCGVKLQKNEVQREEQLHQISQEGI